MKKLKLDREMLKRDVQRLKDDLIRMEKTDTDEGREIDIYISTAALVGAAVLVAGVTTAAAFIIAKKRKRGKCCCCECEQEPIKVEPVKIDLEEDFE